VSRTWRTVTGRGPERGKKREGYIVIGVFLALGGLGSTSTVPGILKSDGDECTIFHFPLVIALEVEERCLGTPNLKDIALMMSEGN
jgi:hypothetical protein